ncbi:ParA family protein (plasmid) [Mycolicibacterium aubagnense]|jgi:chromosome partitioning protein|uniref:ParA family protein n=1 Tax=Mycolicibacterium aubagnense TaxID=319707 RepID=UPI0013F5EDCA|nr:ParA family protein [Mycolicibacterium aubagnense]WGI35952.1 ParA family protein [Mycolicibacterium aubagnense]
MSIYTFANMAGSAGKTTTGTTLATLAAHRGARVRLIDFDPQANATKQLGYAYLEDGVPTIADVVNETATIADVDYPALVPAGIGENGEPFYDEDSVIENLTVVPAVTATLGEFAPRLPLIRGGLTRLRRAIAAAPPVDVTIIDSPGAASNALTVSAMMATRAFPDDVSSGVITCTWPQPKEVEGIVALRREIAAINEEYGTDVSFRGIVICSVPNRRGQLYTETIEDLQAGYGALVAPSVKQSIHVPEAYGLFTPVPLYSRAKTTTKEYAAVLEHFLEQGLFPEVKKA